MTTAGNGPSCSGCVTNVSIRPEGVSISTKRSSMVPVTLCRRGRQRQDGGRPLVLAWRRISLSSVQETRDAIRPALRSAATVQGHQRRLERAVQGDAGTVRPGRESRLRQSVVRGASLPHRVFGLAVPRSAARRVEPADQADPDRLRRVYLAVAPRSEEHTSELQSPDHLVCRLLLEKKKTQSAPKNSPTQ